MNTLNVRKSYGNRDERDQVGLRKHNGCISGGWIIQLYNPHLCSPRCKGKPATLWSKPNKISPPQRETAAAAAAKSLQSCPTLCDPIDGSPPGSPVPGILQARTLEWVAISFSNAWEWKEKVKSLSRVWLFTTPWTSAYQALPSMGFHRQEYCSGLPSPSLQRETVLGINLLQGWSLKGEKRMLFLSARKLSHLYIMWILYRKKKKKHWWTHFWQTRRDIYNTILNLYCDMVTRPKCGVQTPWSSGRRSFIIKRPFPLASCQSLFQGGIFGYSLSLPLLSTSVFIFYPLLWT